VPQPGEPGVETWLNDSAQTGGGNAGVWATISADEELGLAYLPVESPYGDMYGGLRPGANLYGESIVAVDLRTGERRWHFQTSHHPLWDYDIPTAPILVDAVKDGRTVKALAQATKQGLLFVLNRETGEPIWPIPEVAVPQGNVPGEWYSPTQPIPSLRYGHQGVATDDLIDFTPALRAEAEQLVAKHRIGPIYTPAVPFNPNGPVSTLMVMGGSNWPGGSYDPESKIIYVTSSVAVNSMTICRYAEGSVMPHGICLGPDAGAFGGVRSLSVQGLPLLKPPYGTIAAFDLAKGELLWEVPNGDTPENVRNHPALQGVNLGRTGRAGQPPGALATKTLLIAAEPGYGPTPDGKRGSMLRAYDKRTGRELAALQLPAPQSGSPMTYMKGGRQFLVIAVSANDYPGELLAYALPQVRPATRPAAGD
jgi:quinoprotein glucose dehydrogenase